MGHLAQIVCVQDLVEDGHLFAAEHHYLQHAK